MYGAVAQLGERRVRNAKVGGSTPLGSTRGGPWGAPACDMPESASMQDVETLRKTIDQAWDVRAELRPTAEGPVAEAVAQALSLLNRGALRVACKEGGRWIVLDWLKKAVLLSFRLRDAKPVSGGPAGSMWMDKVEMKFRCWEKEDFQKENLRLVPGAIVRRPAFIGSGAVLMPCFVNLGAYVGAGTMIDTWATVGSCAQIGENCHISGGVGIGGVLEPVQARPVIVEDNCFIGARSEVAEGVHIEAGSVLAMGVYLSASTKIVDRATGAVTYGRIPSGSVVVPGSFPSARGPSLYCAVIVKRVDARTRARTSTNQLLRDGMAAS